MSWKKTDQKDSTLQRSSRSFGSLRSIGSFCQFIAYHVPILRCLRRRKDANSQQKMVAKITVTSLNWNTILFAVSLIPNLLKTRWSYQSISRRKSVSRLQLVRSFLIENKKMYLVFSMLSLKIRKPISFFDKRSRSA